MKEQIGQQMVYLGFKISRFAPIFISRMTTVNHITDTQCVVLVGP